MSLVKIIGWLLRLDDVDQIESISGPMFVEPWAEAGWLLIGGIFLAALSIVFYWKAQPHGRTKTGMALAVGRAVLLVLLMLVLGNPHLQITYAHRPKPVLWMLFDGTDSMAIQDDYTAAEKEKLAQATAVESLNDEVKTNAKGGYARQDYVKALLTKDKDNLFDKLAEKYTLQAYTFQRAGGVDALQLKPSADGKSFDKANLASQIKTDGVVTAIGDAIKDVSLRKATNDVAGLVLFSDFGNNAGIQPADTDTAPSRQLGVPIYTVGIGPTEAVDVAVDLQAPPVMKKNERSTVGALIRATGLEGRKITVRMTAKKIDGDRLGPTIAVGQREVILTRGTAIENFDYVPKDSGRYLFAADIDKLEEEQADQNNHAEREVRVRDDYLRLMFVENEPTWEWRFIKEVFHRDPLVGQRGFRTFLRSADARVRQSNELFLPTLTPKRSDFFLTDVIFIGDMPPGSLNARFCEMAKEFVEKFGGGLVVITGPRFGPSALADTAIETMLPVILDKEARIKDKQEFQFQLTPAASQYDFMRLGNSNNPAEAERENAKAWGNLGRVPWYQPVANKHPTLSTVLAEHPTDLCNDGKTRQPLIAIRQYGKGQVVYVGFDEMWRLRRKYGELYYRQFWGQMIHQLGLSHAIGEQKRFVVRTDAQQYKEDEDVTVTIEAFDANYLPLTDEKLPDRRLSGELMLPPDKDGQSAKQPFTATLVKEGVFEARFKAAIGGEHRLIVHDPIAPYDSTEVRFQVAGLSAERRSAVRDVNLQRDITDSSKGRMYDLTTVAHLADDLTLQPNLKYTSSIKPMWNNWAIFGVLVGLMLVEWFTRKMMNLP